jgi:KUP system potassium uptake protein
VSPTTKRVIDEAAHKADPESIAPSPTAKRRTFNESAHKVAYWHGNYGVRQAPGHDVDGDGYVPGRDQDADVVAHAGRAVLALGALGVVYGDIGTSPLYTEQTIFLDHPRAAAITHVGVYGMVSLIFWALMIVVSIKYAGFIMRAHNRGDGGIMALAALLQRKRVARAAVLVTLGIFGAALFFGDGMITPAISVLSAIEGLKVAAPGLAHLVVPIALAILVVLFMVQRFGTGAVGWLFGPVMLFWFVILAVLGLREVIHHPGVLEGLSPTWGVRFFFGHPGVSFLALGSVVLCVTGAEALYADRGHFGPGPIRTAWFTVVFPGVLLSYLGQAALVLHNPATKVNPFYYLVPSWGRVPMVFLAAVATVIASQAVISGSYSVARQAVQMGFLPRVNILHTSRLEGQIYVPAVNWALCLGVVALVLGFQASEKLANAYGVAVTGTFVLNTVLFLVVARALWRAPTWRLATLGALFLTVEVAFFAANLVKIVHGAWFPLVIGVAISGLMLTWHKGRDIVTRNRIKQEGSLDAFLDGLRNAKPPVVRVPGVAIFLNPGRETTPLALRAEVDHTHALHQKVVIVSVEQLTVPQVDEAHRFEVRMIGHGLWKVAHVSARFGYQEHQDVPAALALARKRGLLERNLDLEGASYFLSRINITLCDEPEMHRWRKRLFVAMARNAASPIDHFGLPTDRTVIMGAQVTV